MMGSVTDACTSATMPADCAMEVIIHAAPTDCISPPRLETVLAAQTARNTGNRSGDSADKDCDAFSESGSVRVIRGT
jgi:hypothetical protein